jgi:hypothetical protein
MSLFAFRAFSCCVYLHCAPYHNALIFILQYTYRAVLIYANFTFSHSPIMPIFIPRLLLLRLSSYFSANSYCPSIKVLNILVAYATLFDLLFSQADIDTSTFYIQ